MGKNYLKYHNTLVPIIGGAKGGKGGGGGGAEEDPNSLFSTDIVFITNALARTMGLTLMVHKTLRYKIMLLTT